jgi:hypothetical protein
MDASRSPRQLPSRHADCFSEDCIAVAAARSSASIPQLNFGGDGNDRFPPDFVPILVPQRQQRLFQPWVYEATAPYFSALWRRQLENGQIDVGSSGCTVRQISRRNRL